MMTCKRQKEMLNRIVDDITVARTVKESIQKLLHLGFTPKEIEKDFNFSHDDVVDAEESMDKYDELADDALKVWRRL